MACVRLLPVGGPPNCTSTCLVVSFTQLRKMMVMVKAVLFREPCSVGVYAQAPEVKVTMPPFEVETEKLPMSSRWFALLPVPVSHHVVPVTLAASRCNRSPMWATVTAPAEQW